MKNAPDVHYSKTAFINTTAPMHYFISSKHVISQHLSFDNLYTELNAKLIYGKSAKYKDYLRPFYLLNQ